MFSDPEDAPTPHSATGRPEPEPAPTLFGGLDDAIYKELRRLAAWHLGDNARHHTLRPTALVNEAMIRMAGQGEDVRSDPVRFKATAALMLWRVLQDYDKSKRAVSHGGAARHVELEEEVATKTALGPEVQALRDALSQLHQVNARVGQVIVLRFFGGLTVEETAEKLELSRRQVEHDSKFGKGWLRRELGGLDALQ